jgi:hypothetical protein
MNSDTALRILEAVDEGGYLQEPIPEDEDKLIADAEFYYKYAEAVPEADRDEAIQKIVKLGEAGVSQDGYVPEEEEPSEPLAEKDAVRTTKREAPDMPYDVTEVKDREVRKLSSRFQVHLNEVTRELSVVQTQMLRAKQLRDAAHRNAYLAEANASRAAGTKLSQAVLDMAATNSPAVQEKESELFELEVKERDLRALRDIYKGNVDRLSREMTMRTEELRAQARRH